MKLIISDLDGTLLLRGEKKIHRLALSAIEKVLNSGFIFCVASGRNYGEIKRLLGSFANKAYIIANDGALTVYKEETIAETPFGDTEISHINAETDVVLHAKYLSFVKSERDMFVRNIKEQYFGNVLRFDEVGQIDRPVYKLSLYGKKPDFEGFDRVYSDKTVSEYVKNGVNKATALSGLLKRLKIKEDDVIAIGDGPNDAEMLALAGKSYVIASAPPKVKKSADCVVNDFMEATESILKE